MKYPVIVLGFLKVSGMALYPFIAVQHSGMKTDPILIRHETIHLKQAEELLVLPFYVLYLLNYLINLIRFRNHQKAYMHIVFEQEAYHYERDANYLHQRPLWAWRRFFIKT